MQVHQLYEYTHTHMYDAFDQIILHAIYDYVRSLHVLIISCVWSSAMVIYQGVPADRCISFRCTVLWSTVVVVGDWSISVSLLNQDSDIESLNISQMMCSTQQAVTTCGILIIFTSFLFVSLLHLALSHPNAFSTTIRDLDKV